MSSHATAADRMLAREQAKLVLKNEQPPEADIPYLEETIVEAVLFESPMKNLEVGLNQLGHHYTITIKVTTE